jgi:transcriptional regulator with XRE-family HTH domain
MKKPLKKRRALAKSTPSPIEPCYVLLGTLIYERRLKAGLTQREVGDALGWTRASIANLEGGRQRLMLHDLPLLADVLSTPLLVFLDPNFFE